MQEMKAKANARVAAANRKLAEADANTKHLVLTVAAVVEVGGTCYAFGYARAYYGEKKLLRLPIEAWVGLGFHALGLYFDLTAKSGDQGEINRIVGEQLHNVGNGAVGAYAHTLGAEHGAKALEQKQGTQTQPATAGMLPYAGAYTGAPMLPQPQPQRHLTDAVLDTIAANI